ncbi:hypothetical protein RHMOL_Rhmol12G0154500 [Rhododendron molle]|uniref:Uncharacterized protein n=1 Tax=Rhododendron molle TaxID=49168 RepID=A0ACC0LJS4_RHOML|nr:hypothetical protein RHMOL_Rhmol12G0154500 [Rhododendron molle]
MAVTVAPSPPTRSPYSSKPPPLHLLQLLAADNCFGIATVLTSSEERWDDGCGRRPWLSLNLYPFSFSFFVH